jgi:hypothetical protein
MAALNKTIEEWAFGKQVARDFANWHIGDESWADEIIFCLLNPHAAKEELISEGAYDVNDS